MRIWKVVRISTFDDDELADSIIYERMRSIEKFMEGITIHPIVKNCELLNLFLSMENNNEYHKQIKKYENIKSKTEVKQIITLNGLINVGISVKKETYLFNINNYCQANSNILQKITEEYKSLMDTMSELSDKMENISELFDGLLDISIRFYDNDNISKSFKIMKKFMKEWAQIQENQIEIVNENIREYLRYIKNEFNLVEEMANKVSNYKTQYETTNDKLTKTKETLFKKRDIQSWQLNKEDKEKKLDLFRNKKLAFSKMLPNDTIKVIELKNFYGCMLNSLISEFERIRKVNERRHSENFNNFIKKLSKEYTNMIICLADKFSDFIDLKNENDVHNIDGGIQLKKVKDITENPNHENNNNNIINENNINNINEIDFENNDKFEEN